jgi:Transposase IS116/IS110/IS902 family
LRPKPRRRLDALLRLVDDFDREIAALSVEIDARATDDPRVDVLRQIRGIGRYIGLLIVAEIGDIERLPTARHLCAWAGLTPTVRSSDAKARLGHISGMGSTALRWALVEAAQKNSHSGGPLRDCFERIAKRRGRQIAKVAIARKILTPSASTHCATARSARSNPPARPTRRKSRRPHEGRRAFARAPGRHPSNPAHARASSLPCLAPPHSGRPPSWLSPQAPHDTLLRPAQPNG